MKTSSTYRLPGISNDSLYRLKSSITSSAATADDVTRLFGCCCCCSWWWGSSDVGDGNGKQKSPKLSADSDIHLCWMYGRSFPLAHEHEPQPPTGDRPPLPLSDNPEFKVPSHGLLGWPPAHPCDRQTRPRPRPPLGRLRFIIMQSLRQ